MTKCVNCNKDIPQTKTSFKALGVDVEVTTNASNVVNDPRPVLQHAVYCLPCFVALVKNYK